MGTSTAKESDATPVAKERAPRVGIIVGASGGIAQAMIKNWQDHEVVDVIVAFSRRDNSTSLETDEGNSLEKRCKVYWIKTESDEDSIANAVDQWNALRQRRDDTMEVTHVCICCGVLHDEHFQPEKNIKQIKSSSFLNVMAINALTPLLWLRYLEPLITQSKRCVVSVFSARVGSISDNRLGGVVQLSRF